MRKHSLIEILVNVILRIMNNITTPKIISIHCEYCDTLFYPTRRFVQKYCTESCRTLACRERKKGIGGTQANKNRSTSITDLSKEISEMKSMIYQFNSNINTKYQILEIMYSESLRKINETNYLAEKIQEFIKEKYKENERLEKTTTQIKEQLNQLSINLKSLKRNTEIHDIIQDVLIVFGNDIKGTIFDLIKNWKNKNSSQ